MGRNLKEQTKSDAAPVLFGWASFLRLQSSLNGEPS